MYIYIHMCKDELLWPLTLSLSLHLQFVWERTERERERRESPVNHVLCSLTHELCVLRLLLLICS